LHYKRIKIILLRMKVIRILAWLLISFSWCPAQPEYPRILENLPANTVKSFTGANALFHLAAVAATGLLIFTDADYRVHAFFYRHPGADNWFFPVAVAGGLGPVVTGSWFYFSGKHASCPRLAGVGCAVLQASLINITYVSLLKAVTGRPNPDREKYDNMQELSRTFRFGFGRGGIFWGWPSGHTSASLAVLSCLTAYYPEKTWLKAGSAVWMVYTMAGVCAIGDGHMVNITAVNRPLPCPVLLPAWAGNRCYGPMVRAGNW
jgi:membrane-associated phospholipid phosphatase